jgi:carboxypeptidase Q
VNDEKIWTCCDVSCCVLPASHTHAQHHKNKTAPAAVPAPSSYDYAHPEVQPAKESLDLTMYARIRDEGLNHSRVTD